MKVHLVSFATTIEDIDYPDTELRQLRLIESAKKYGINSFFTSTRQDLIKTDFYIQNKEILDYKKGAGYWLWKPYYILEALKKVGDGDIIIYCDNSFYFISSPKPLIDIVLKENFLLFGQTTIQNTVSIEKNTHKKCIQEMNAFEYQNNPLIVAGIQLYIKNTKTLKFHEELLMNCMDKNKLLDNQEDIKFDFERHLHDMSILSILAAKHKIELYRSPCQFGNHQKKIELRINNEFVINNNTYSDHDIFYNSDYPQILEWDKAGIGCKRPFKHYFNFNKLKAFFLKNIYNN